MSAVVNNFHESLVRRAAALPASRVNWVQWFVVSQMVCQLLLLAPALGPFRILARIAAYGTSLALLAILPSRGRSHPAALAAWGVLGILAVELANPLRNSWPAALAQVGLYAAILGPILWVPRLRMTPSMLRQLLLTIWLFHTVSSVFGVLQVYFPGRFQPNLSSVTQAQGQGYVDALKITLASGERVLRPMGLTDTPGGAAQAGFYAVLFGIGFLLVERAAWLKLACLGSMGIGLFGIYLSQQRSTLVAAVICIVVLVVLLATNGHLLRSAKVLFATAVMALVSFGWSVLIGGATAPERLATLTQSDPGTVYYQNRGRFLDHTINVLLPEYPWGAGLGRWGMTNFYLGSSENPEAAKMWVEIQWTGWLLDGGVPLLVMYPLALCAAFLTTWRMVRNRRIPELQCLAALIFAYDVGVLAVTFNYPIFIGQGGMEFWLLNAALFAVTQRVSPTQARSGRVAT